jgi:cell division septation protein DedD
VALLLLFFVAGGLIGRWAVGGAGEPPEPTVEPTGKAEYFVVEVAAVETREKADALVEKLRRQYTSAVAELNDNDRLFHVTVGPYEESAAKAVAEELRRAGSPAVTTRPYRRGGH